MAEQRRRQVEVFSAGCAVCDEASSLVKRLAGDVDDVQTLDTTDRKVANLAQSLGVRSVPAVVITASKLAPCCAAGAGPDEAVLREAGLGRPLLTEQRRRQVEIFSAGCAMCEEAVALVQANACHSCDVQVRDMKDPEVVSLAKSLGIRSVPAVVITASELAACCTERGPDEAVLRREGIGRPIQAGA
jgi:hypothetical protein